MDTQLITQYEKIDQLFDQLNQQAVQEPGLPYVRRDAYNHFCNVKTFLHAYTRKLRPDEDTFREWLMFCYQDTLNLKSRIGSYDLYAFTFHYLKTMTFRTGNLDTPDDCVEILSLDLFLPYMEAREKQWHHIPLTQDEENILKRHYHEVLDILQAHLPIQH